MIIKFKLYETLNQGEPKIGDYVICDINYGFLSIYVEFVSNSIGKIFKKSEDCFYVKYYNIPEEILSDFKYSDYSERINVGNAIFVHETDVLYWSKNKQDLEEFLATKKSIYDNQIQII